MIYLRLGLLLVVAALVATIFFYRAEATQAAAERDKALAAVQLAVDANNALQATLGRERADAAKNDQLVAQMADDLDAINKSLTETSDTLHDLQASNADVRAYLSGAVPDDLKRVLDR